MYTGLSFLIGGIIALMILMNGALSGLLGNELSLVIIHITGLFVVVSILFIRKEKLKSIKGLPFYSFVAGALGVVTVVFNNLSFVGLGVTLTLVLGLLGQLLASIVVDHFGILGMPKIPFKKMKLVGLFIICLGIYVMTLT